ncbi:hypothetical protein HELRODRAFT_91422, partial [Helobdella robusta]|uniref:Poly [ADP-ribose] polymerase n=1 Tax=Helobdella robusta TaxID=6412 RepID=T1G836_HELRO
YELLELSKNSLEFQKVSKLFHKTMLRPRAAIKRIMLLLNPVLWSYYLMKKLQKEREYKSEVQLNLEKMLFHGIKRKLLDVICMENVDWRKCGVSHGIMFGQGTYFARDASYAHQFTDKPTRQTFDDEHDNDNQPEHIHTMLVVRVLVGKYTRGKTNYRKPPPVDPKNPFGPSYDCCVNYVESPTLYVISDSNQYYPEYVIEYTNMKAEKEKRADDRDTFWRDFF